MSLPKEPRQKMINIMYLVLTAMLALNVSSEILNAFKTVDSSLKTANNTIDGKSQQLIASLNELLDKPETHDKAAYWKPLADQAQKESEDVYNYIDDLKRQLLAEANYDPKTGDFREDDLEAATRLFVEKPKEKGKELYARLDALKNQLLNLNPAIRQELEKTLPIDLSIPKSNNQASRKDWSTAYFHMTPTVAALTILSKFQNDIRNSESQVIEFCHKQVGAVKIVFDQYVPLVGTNATYLMPGQPLEITAGIGAYSKMGNNTKITIDGGYVALNANGVADYKTTVGGPGTYTKNVHIEYFNQATGRIETKEVPISYTVGSPTGVFVSADKVKVLYVGLDNEISVSGGGKGAEAIKASIDNGSLQPLGNGRYIAHVSSPGTADITVSIDGKSATFPFRVKNVPPPTIMVGGSAGGRISANAFKANAGVRAELKDFVFEGVKYSVTGYTIICSGKGFESTGYKYAQVNGAYFNSEARSIIEQCRAGSYVIIQDVSVEGPGGNRRIEGSIGFTLTP